MSRRIMRWKHGYIWITLALFLFGSPQSKESSARAEEKPDWIMRRLDA